ncbi:hypothetical protein D9758_016225 [Tetrapyrgos nigripes]|uniref:Uncharacterized protein n=1 Tax=Tetrapyrgos nigripes TaxID=182062 RepID=A0A8H5C561_9AGAR|nr:hypothetical protein D9758_016225 [Tetrapyrgos nigripes]
MRNISQVAFLLFVSASVARAAIFRSPSELPKGVEYDYVIVGGGVAGSVLANRLTEDANATVLVLEAGGTYDDQLIPHIPFFTTRMPRMYKWNFTSVPQAGINGDSINYGRGFILGGSSAVNGMYYTRGSSEDFERLAAVTEDEGWNWDNIVPYFLKSEKFTPPADGHNTTGDFIPSAHNMGGSGRVAVSLPGFEQSLDNLVIQASQQLGGIFQFNEDQNSGNNLGIGWNTATIDISNRSSAAAAYLTPEDVARDNLHILVNARASRVLSVDGTTDIRSVEYAQDLDGPFFTVNATREVLITSGVFGTPAILLNSGIGSAAYLQGLGIQLVLDLPSVGKNFTDQPSISTAWLVNSTTTWDTFNRNQTNIDEALDQWANERSGPLVDTLGNQLGFFRVNDSVLEQFGPDPASGPNSPHLELLAANGLFSPNPPAEGNFMSISINLVSAESRGSFLLNDTDRSPFASPIIDPQYLSTKFDKVALREGIKTAFQFLTAPVFQDYVLGFSGDLLNGTLPITDDLIDQYVAENTATSNHPIGTCSMSPKGAQWGVVDPDFRVKGARGLRIVDASTFPYNPSAHPMSVMYAMAERAADLIKADSS